MDWDEKQERQAQKGGARRAVEDAEKARIAGESANDSESDTDNIIIVNNIDNIIIVNNNINY